MDYFFYGMVAGGLLLIICWKVVGRSDVPRLILEFRYGAWDRIHDLQKTCKARNEAELIRFALGCYDLLLETSKDKKTVIVSDGVGVFKLDLRPGGTQQENNK